MAHPCPLSSALSALHPSSAPARLPGRESESQSLKSFLRACVSRGRSGSVHVCGSPGVGKTATVTRVVAELETWAASERLPVSVITVNGMALSLDAKRVRADLSARCAAADAGGGVCKGVAPSPAAGGSSGGSGGGADGEGGSAVITPEAAPARPRGAPSPRASAPAPAPVPAPTVKKKALTAADRAAAAAATALSFRKAAVKARGSVFLATRDDFLSAGGAAAAHSSSASFGGGDSAASPRAGDEPSSSAAAFVSGKKRSRDAADVNRPPQAASHASGGASSSASNVNTVDALAAMTDSEYAAAHGGVVFGRGARMHLVVLDECDALLSRSRDVLESLFRWPHEGGRVVLISISNAVDLTERLLPTLRADGVAPALLVFCAYKAESLSAIMHERVGRVSGPAAGRILDPAAITLIAKRIAAGDGDLRKALYIARKAVLGAAVQWCALAGADRGPHDEALSKVLSDIAGGGGGGGDGGGDDEVASSSIGGGGGDSAVVCTCVGVDGVTLAWAPTGGVAGAALPTIGSGGYAATFPAVIALVSAAFDSRFTRHLLDLPRSAQMLICAARGLAERTAAARAHSAAYVAARAEERAGRAVSGTFEGAAISFGHAATSAGAYKAVGGEAESAVAGYGSLSASGVGVTIGSLRDAFTRLCRKQLLTVVDPRDFADLLDRLEATGLVAFTGRVGMGGGKASSAARGGRMTSAGGDRVTSADAWAQK